jgi:dihydrofolate reductase/ketosteroid isomerase-like protein
MRENVEFLRQGYEALQRGDLETFKALARERLDPAFEFHLVWDGRVLRGYEGTLEWLSDTRDTWQDYSQEVHEIIDLGQDVVVVLHISARGSGSGVPVEQEFAVVWTFEGERAVSARSFSSAAEALESARSAEGRKETSMRKVVLKMDMSIDGYVGPLDEDAEWIMRDFDDELSQWIVDEVLWRAGTHVMGRTTYEEMAEHWPSSDAVYAEPMNEIPKVVFSKTLTDARWPETRIASGDLAGEIHRLREEPGKDILVHGGSELVRSLSRENLIDEYRLIVHPAALGSGAPLFGGRLDLRLASSRAFATGAVALTYQSVRA